MANIIWRDEQYYMKWSRIWWDMTSHLTKPDRPPQSHPVPTPTNPIKLKLKNMSFHKLNNMFYLTFPVILPIKRYNVITHNMRYNVITFCWQHNIIMLAYSDVQNIINMQHNIIIHLSFSTSEQRWLTSARFSKSLIFRTHLTWIQPDIWVFVWFLGFELCSFRKCENPTQSNRPLFIYSSFNNGWTYFTGLNHFCHFHFGFPFNGLAIDAHQLISAL